MQTLREGCCNDGWRVEIEKVEKKVMETSHLL